MFEVSSGKASPLGIKVKENGVNFAIFSRNAKSVSLAIFDDPESEKALFIFNFDTLNNKTGDVWHCFVNGLKENYYYGYFMDGPKTPGHYFDKSKLLLDPYSKAVYLSEKGLDDESLFSSKTFKNSSMFAPKGLIFKPEPYKGEKLRNFELKDQIIYELHVKGFTKTLKTPHSGTYKGIVEKIPYLKELGITAIELMPINIFDCYKTIRENKEGNKLVNYWGYDSINFFSIQNSYSSKNDLIKTIDEFKLMVDELHKNNIGVLLDVVFNHTSEGNEEGPIFSFKGIDSSIYYMLNGFGRFKNFSGCGNTVNCNHPVVIDLIIDALSYFVIYMGVDGFRFDLASILSRDSNGDIKRNTPLLERIAESPILRACVIIAEAWDAAGAYQVGNFGGSRWAEWNGKYRDYIKQFFKADFASMSRFADSFVGSPSIYNGKGPDKSINFVTSHDGFTLSDLVSYNDKHNIANGENNNDGENNNLSWNCGAEGPSTDVEIIDTRKKQMKNFISALMLSLGVPMLKAGDEFCHSQGGNNNPYCQDNEISWLNWSNLETNQGFFRFVKEMINFRKMNPALRRKHYYEFFDNISIPEYCDISWYGSNGKKPDWSPTNHDFAVLLKGWIEKEPREAYYNDDILVIFNTFWEDQKYVLPKIYKREWLYFCDTAKKEPDDIKDPSLTYKLENQDFYFVNKRSIVILLGRYKGKKKDNLIIL